MWIVILRIKKCNTLIPRTTNVPCKCK